MYETYGKRDIGASVMVCGSFLREKIARSPAFAPFIVPSIGN